MIALAWVLLIFSLIGWPTSILWWATSEPPAILSLSWLALVYGAVGTIFTAKVNRKVDES